MLDAAIHDYVLNQKRLLELELRSEEEEERNQASSSSSCKANNSINNNLNDQEDFTNRRNNFIIRNLQVNEWSVGLMGRTVITLSCMKGEMKVKDENDHEATTNSKSSCSSKKGDKRKKDDDGILLPAHRLTVGDEVEIMSKYSNQNRQQQQQNGESSFKKRKKSGGVISAMSDTSISIALFGNMSDASSNNKNAQKESNDNEDDEASQILGAPPLTIIPRPSIDVHRKMIDVLNKLEKEGIDHHYAGKIIQEFFNTENLLSQKKKNKTENDTNNNDHDGELSNRMGVPFIPFNSNLDESQIEAIKFCIESDKPISLIHGPPGTGKTTTVAELIHQAVHVYKMRVLVTAPSNVAVDNVLERLVSGNKKYSSTKSKKINRNQKQYSTNQLDESNIRAVRIGHPARIQTSILRYSLEALVQNSDGTEIVSDIRSELQSYLRVVSNPKSRGGDKRSAYKEMKILRKEIRQREEMVVHSLIADAQVVLATNVGAASFILDKYERSPMSKPFDLVVIDEAAQALEVSCWIPILRGKKVVLAGDHCQLPPTIKSSNHEVQKGLSQTMFERVMKYPNVSRMLQIQYRMHEDIADFASRAMYHGKLLSHDSVRSRKLYHLSHILRGEETDKSDEDVDMISMTRDATLLLIDTAGCEMFESVNVSGSRYNEDEAAIVEQHVKNLIQIGLNQEDIAIITPYNGQVEILKNLLLADFPKLEIRSVDGFQGGEREAVVLTLVRSSDRNGAGGVGFLRDKRRLNVAITRAKRQCTVICDSDTVSQNKFLKGLIDWMETKGEYFSAMEYINGDYTKKNISSSIVKHEDKLQLQPPLLEEKSKLPEQSEQKESLTKAVNAVADEVGKTVKATSFLDTKEAKAHLKPHHKSQSANTETKKKTSRKLSSNSKPIIVSKLVTTEVQKDTRNKSNSQTELTIQKADSAQQPEDSGSKNESLALNSLLATLAKERALREQEKAGLATNSKVKKKKKAKSGGKVGGKKANEPCPKIDDDLDDMAFLDAQIAQVQTSHGRTIESSGKGYRSIINGILLAKPKTQEKKRDSRAAGALSAKIKEAEIKRKAKSKKN